MVESIKSELCGAIRFIRQLNQIAFQPQGINNIRVLLAC